MREKNDLMGSVFLEKMRSIVGHQTFKTLLIIFGVYLIFQLAMLIRVPMVVSNEIKTEFSGNDSKVTRLEVSFDITPEDFHIKMLQRYGAIGGVTDHSIYLMYVPYKNVSKIARLYWVKRIDIPNN